MSDQEIELERVYTVPLSRAWITARHRRTRRAVHIIREFAEHHMKSSEIKIATDLNEEIWKRGITKPPRRITVKMEKDEDGVVTVSLPKEAKKKQEPLTPAMTSEPPAEPASNAVPAPISTPASTASSTPTSGASQKSARKSSRKKAAQQT